jgi:hypothetical protein
MISDILKLLEISGGFKPGQPDRQCYHLISLGKNIPIYQPYASPALKTQVISDVNCYEIQNQQFILWMVATSCTTKKDG